MMVLFQFVYPLLKQKYLGYHSVSGLPNITKLHVTCFIYNTDINILGDMLVLTDNFEWCCP